MPKARLSTELFDIQIKANSDRRFRVDQLVCQVMEVLPKLLGRYIKACQEHWLTQDLGPPGTVGNLFDDGTIQCPRCQARGANRKEWKKRTWTVEKLGELRCELRWVECRECGASWRPYRGPLGIAKYTRYSPRVKMNHVEEAIQTTYEKASRLREDSPSAMTIWRWLVGTAPEGPPRQSVEETVCMDATRVPRWRQTGQWDLSVAQGLTRAPDGSWRREPVAGSVGKEASIKDQLSEVSIRRLMHDGKLEVEQLCEQEGRCSWHVPHTVRVLLYQDGITGEDNKTRCGQLRSIVFDRQAGPREVDRRLKEWIERNKNEAPKAASHVQRARAGIRTVRANRQAFGMIANSLLEREMVELNKRFENGGGWTQHGGGAMVRHHQLWRHQPETWRQRMRQIVGVGMPDNQQNSHS